jgi:predicted NodU family carbamoyl transferase
MNILGLNAFHGDASAAVLRDGQLVAAIEEERLNRIKHWAGLPGRASGACLEGAQPHYIGISRTKRRGLGRLREMHRHYWRKHPRDYSGDYSTERICMQRAG